MSGAHWRNNLKEEVAAGVRVTDTGCITCPHLLSTLSLPAFPPKIAVNRKMNRNIAKVLNSFCYSKREKRECFHGIPGEVNLVAIPAIIIYICS